MSGGIINQRYQEFVPTTPGDWSPVPTKNSDALDQLAANAVAAYTPLSNIRYVDRTIGNDVTGNGSINKPYQTIQAALNSIGDSTSAADVKVPAAVFITAGSYDENLTIPTGRIVSLYALGTVILGDGALANWGSTTPRSISCTFDNASVFGSDIKPALNLIGVPQSDATSTFVAESGMFRVSGDINIAGNGLSHTVNFHSAWIDGVINKTAIGLTNFQSYRSLFVGALNMGTATIIERAEDSQFNALITVDGYNAFINSEIRAGLTCATNFDTIPPSGLFHTSFTGVFTAPANGVKLDPTSYYFFKTNAATLGGAASIVLLSDAEGLKYTPTTPGDWGVVPANVQAALDELAATAGGGTVTDVTASAPLASTGGTTPDISIPQSGAGTDGYLSSADWNTFNNKQPAGNYITDLTGDVTASGPGSVAATIAANAVTNSKLAQMAAATIKGNNTGGASDPLDLTGTQTTALLDVFTDLLKGLAPASGGGTTNFLRADGTWAAPGGGGSVMKGYFHKVTAGEVAAKAITLPVAPATDAEVMAAVRGGSPLLNDAADPGNGDYAVTGTAFNWTALGLDGVIAADDWLVIWYQQ